MLVDRILMNRFIMLLFAISLLFGIMGCTRNTAREEMRRYNMQAYQEGNQKARSDGRGLNGQILETMQGLFKEMNILLTNETYVKDPAGNLSYQYLMNNDSNQLITLHIFADEQARVNGMNKMYGIGVLSETDKMDNMIIAYKGAALVYTSAGVKRNQYSEQVKQVALKVLKHIPRNPTR